MTPSNDLFLLIKNLSATEKRYFTIWSSKHTVGKKNSYLKLFEDIDYYAALHDEYDEKEFLKKYKNKPYTKNFAYHKNYLFGQVMEAMRTYGKEENDISQTIFDLLKDIKFYKGKRLLPLWEKAIERAEELAAKHEKNHLLLLILKEKHEYEIENNQRNLQKILATHFEERSAILKWINDSENLEALQSWFFLLVRIYGQGTLPVEVAESIEKNLGHPILVNYQPGNSKKNDSTYYSIYQWVYFLKKDAEKSNGFIEKRYAIVMHKDSFMPVASQITTASNYLSSLLLLKKWEQYALVLQQMKDIPATTENEKGEQFQNVIFYEQLLYLNTGKLDNACMMETIIRVGLKKYAHKINAARRIAMLMNLGLSYFLNDHFEQAQTLFDEISNEQSPARKDIKLHAKFLYLITLYETKEHEKLENAIRNIHRSKNAEEYKTNRLYFLVEVLNELIKSNHKPTLIIPPILEKQNPDNLATEIKVWTQSKIYRAKLSVTFKQSLG